MLIFPGVTIQDFIGPYEVLSRVADFEIQVCAPRAGEIRTETGLCLVASKALAEISRTDILFVPGGPGVNDLLENKSAIGKIAELGANAEYVTSVCTGSLVLGAAGLLRGYRATTHWRYVELLKMGGAIFTESRVVVDRNRITGGGVTAGIDFALLLVAQLVSEARAQEIQLEIEYNPAPPFTAGHPSVAPHDIVNTVRRKTEASFLKRRQLLEKYLRPR